MSLKGILKRRKSVEASCPCVLGRSLLTKTRVPHEETALVGMRRERRIGQLSYVPTDVLSSYPNTREHICLLARDNGCALISCDKYGVLLYRCTCGCKNSFDDAFFMNEQGREFRVLM
jgi:hypothetical protein